MNERTLRAEPAPRLKEFGPSSGPKDTAGSQNPGTSMLSNPVFAVFWLCRPSPRYLTSQGLPHCLENVYYNHSYEKMDLKGSVYLTNSGTKTRHLPYVDGDMLVT